MPRTRVEWAEWSQEVLETEGIDGFCRELRMIAAPDVEWVEDPTWPGAQHLRGCDAVEARLHEITEIFPVEQSLERVVEAGDQVVAFLVWRGRSGTTGANSDMPLATITTWRDGRVARVEFFFDRGRALEKAGGEPADANSGPG